MAKKKPVAKKGPSKRTASKPQGAKKAAGKKPAKPVAKKPAPTKKANKPKAAPKPAKKAAPKKAVMKKSAPAPKKAVAKKVVVKKVVTKKPVAAPKPAPTKKAVVPAKKVAAPPPPAAPSKPVAKPVEKAAPKPAPAPTVVTPPAPPAPKAPAKPAAKPAEKRSLKERVVMEFYMRSSPNVLFDLLSTPSGFSEWYCDDVDVRGDQYTFKWGNDEEATTMIGRKAPEVIRFHRNDDTDEASFFEFRIRIDAMTNELALVVTDHAWPNEVEETRSLWSSQIASLMRVLGA